MYFAYHGVPENMHGTMLFPLNNMPEQLSGVRAKSLEKYKGRQEVISRNIPLLDCQWGDVLQLLPLHPKQVFQLQVDLGIIPEVPPYKFYEIAVSTLDPTKTAVFFKSAPGEENIDVKWLKDVEYNTLQKIPEATIAYYKTLTGTGELPFNYQFIPHILYKSSIDVSQAKIISL